MKRQLICVGAALAVEIPVGRDIPKNFRANPSSERSKTRVRPNTTSDLRGNGSLQAYAVPA